MLFRLIRDDGKVGWGESAQTANPAQATAIFGAKGGLFREDIEAGFPLQYKGFPLGRALISAG